MASDSGLAIIFELLYSPAVAVALFYFYIFMSEEGKRGKTRICLERSRKKINILRAMREREEKRRTAGKTLLGDGQRLSAYTKKKSWVVQKALRQCMLRPTPAIKE